MGIHITLIQPVSNPYKFKFKRSPSAAFITGTKKATEVAVDYFQSYAALLGAISTAELYPWL